MNFTVIFLSFAAVFSLCVILDRAFRAFARRELCQSGCEAEGEEIVIYVDADSAEYLLRMALALPHTEIKVVINGRSEDADEAESIILSLKGERSDIEIIRM